MACSVTDYQLQGPVLPNASRGASWRFPANLTQVRDQFPITRRYAYLNHASVGGLSEPMVGAMTRYLTERGQSGSEALTCWDADIERVRQACARFVSAHRDEIVFTGSISHGLNIVACGLDWRDGDNLICAETEFTANIYPWVNLQRRGVEVRFAPARENRILVEDVASLMDHRTVSYTHLTLPTTKALCRYRWSPYH